MRMCWKTAAMVGVIALLARSAPAQGPGGGAFANPGMLLMNDGVQRELKLTDEQKQEVRKAGREFMEKHKDEFAKLRDASPEERRKALQELSQESMKTYSGILKPEQTKRLKELTLQARGPQAFADPEVQSALKLTDEQKDKIKTIGADARKEMEVIFQGARDNREEAMKKFQALRKETMTKVEAVLTDDQKKTWKELTGEKFELKFEPRGPGGERQPGEGQRPKEGKSGG